MWQDSVGGRWSGKVVWSVKGRLQKSLIGLYWASVVFLDVVAPWFSK